MPRFNESRDGVGRCSVRTTQRFTRQEWGRLEDAARLKGTTARELVLDALRSASLTLWDFVRDIESGEAEE